MDLWQSVLLAMVQGLTEFLPISSSAHLILMPYLFGWTDQGLAFDVAVHVGSLLAVVVYFRRELLAMSRAWLRHASGGIATPDSRLAWAVILATVPVVVIGPLANVFAEDLRDPLIIALATALFALVLWWADGYARADHDEYRLSWRQVLVIGFAQVLALIPGTSRSGITITAALALGLSRRGAARFSFLLSIPVIVAAGTLKGYELLAQAQAAPWGPLALGVLVSGLAAYACIHWFLRLVERIGMLPFVLYRLALAGVLLYLYV